MDSEPRDMDLWIKETLNRWAEQGNLSADKTAQLDAMIAELSHQERKNRFTRAACGIVATVMACIWLLFTSCTVAAAAYMDSAIHSPHCLAVQVLSLLAILCCFFINYRFYSQIKNANYEVNYE